MVPASLAEQAMRSVQHPPAAQAKIFTPRVGWAAAAFVAVTVGLATGWLHSGAEDPSQTLAVALYAPSEAADAS